MWKQKWLVFTVIVVILLQISKQDGEEFYGDRPERVGHSNAQIVLNFFLHGTEHQASRPYYGEGPYSRKISNGCDCNNCDCENCDCKECDCENMDKKLVFALNKIESNENSFDGKLNNRFIDSLRKMKKSFKNFLRDINDGIPATAKCESCVATIDLFLEYRRNIQFMSDNSLRKIATELCSFIQSEEFCEGVLNLHFDLIMYIVDSKPDLTAETICNIAGQALGCFVPRESDKFNSWKINIPPPLKKFKPNTIHNNANANPFQILQISDIHYDRKYKKGMKVKCKEPICCRTEPNFLEMLDEKAGQWGHYKKCDMPMESVKNLMIQTSQHDIDYVYFTGDVIAHNIWETSIESNSESLVEVYRLFYYSFVTRNITLYPILGNHEFNPLNSNPPKNGPIEFSQQWLFDLIAEIWGAWLPQDTLETIKRGGFYTVVPKPGFRIIALNSNVAYVYNWWLLYNDTDPYGQLQWLADTLSLAEQNNEYVHILSHVPPGEKDTYAKWAHEYTRIIHRFAHIITGQFCGHTHNVQMYYFYEPNNIGYPVNIMYNGGSFTTYQDNNPNYRVYYVDPETMAVENFDDWSFNLTMANKFGEPQWTYTNFRQTFGLTSMSYEEMGHLIYKMVANKSYLDTYFRLKVRSGDTSLQEGCNNKCLAKNLCSIFKTEADSNELCNYFVDSFKSNHYHIWD